MLETIPGVTCTVRDPSQGIVQVIPGDQEQIFILQRMRTNQEMYISLVGEIVAKCPRCIVVTEIDDNPEFLQGIPESDFISLRCVHAIQCSTERLAEVCGQWNPKVMVFPNMIAELPPPRIYRDASQVRLFFGAQNRKSDWLPIMPTLNRVLRDYANIHFTVVHDREFFDALSSDGPDDYTKVFSPWLDYPEYRRTLRSCDIALLPLEPTPFNACKSDLKFIECVAEGVACLMSKTAFDQIPTDRIGYQRGALAETWKSTQVFEQSLRELIENRERRHLVASNAYDYVKNHRMLGQHFRDRLTWYRSLLTRKHELDSLLLERVPSLRSLP